MHLRSRLRSSACRTGHVPEVGGGVNTYLMDDVKTILKNFGSVYKLSF